VSTTADVVGVLSSLGLSEYAATFEKEVRMDDKY
jgi:hypothetical protein